MSNIDLEYISNPANRFNVRPSEMASFLRKMGFEVSDDGENTKCTHPALEKPYSYVSNKKNLDPRSVKKIFEDCIKIENSQLDNNIPNVEILELGTEIDETLDVVRSGDRVTASFKELPELQRNFNLHGEYNSSYVNKVRIFREEYDSTIEELQKIKSNYNVDLIRTEDAVIFNQSGVDLELIVTRLPESSFVSKLSTTVFEVSVTLAQIVDARMLALYELETQGHAVVSENNDLITISDPRHPDDKPVSFSTEPAALLSKATSYDIEQLQNLYPKMDIPETIELQQPEMVGPIMDIDIQEEVFTPVETVSHPVQEDSAIAATSRLLRQGTPLPELPVKITPRRLAEVAARLFGSAKASVETPAPIQPPIETVEPAIAEPKSDPVPSAISPSESVSEPEPELIPTPEPVLSEIEMKSEHSTTPPDVAATTAPEVQPSKRMMAIVKPQSYQQPDVTEESYKGTFGERIVRHRNERGYTEDAFKDEIRNVITKQKEINGDTVVAWEESAQWPNRPILDALVKILIHENPTLAENDKPSLEKNFKYAHSETRALLENRSNSVRANTFGPLVKKYRRLLKLGEDALSDVVAAEVRITPAEDVNKLTYLDIALIQNNIKLPSPGLVQAMIKVFEKPGTEGLKSVEFDEEDKALFVEAYDALVFSQQNAAQPSAANSNESRRGPIVSQEARNLRAEFAAMFTDKNGEKLSMGQIAEYSSTFGKGGSVNMNDLANYMGVDRTSYVPLSDMKIVSILDTLGAIYMEINGDRPKEDADLMESRFDRLTAVYQQAKQENLEHRQQIGGGRVVPGSSTQGYGSP